MHGEDGPDAVLDEGPLDLLAGGQDRQPLGAVRVFGDDADRLDPAPRVP